MASVALSKSSLEPSPVYIGGRSGVEDKVSGVVFVASREDSVVQDPPKGAALGSAFMAFFFQAGISSSNDRGGDWLLRMLLCNSGVSSRTGRNPTNMR